MVHELLHEPRARKIVCVINGQDYYTSTHQFFFQGNFWKLVIIKKNRRWMTTLRCVRLIVFGVAVLVKLLKFQINLHYSFFVY